MRDAVDVLGHDVEPTCECLDVLLNRVELEQAQRHALDDGHARQRNRQPLGELGAWDSAALAQPTRPVGLVRRLWGTRCRAAQAQPGPAEAGA